MRHLDVRAHAHAVQAALDLPDLHAFGEAEARHALAARADERRRARAGGRRIVHEHRARPGHGHLAAHHVELQSIALQPHEPRLAGAPPIGHGPDLVLHLRTADGDHAAHAEVLAPRGFDGRIGRAAGQELHAHRTRIAQVDLADRRLGPHRDLATQLQQRALGVAFLEGHLFLPGRLELLAQAGILRSHGLRRGERIGQQRALETLGATGPIDPCGTFLLIHAQRGDLVDAHRTAHHLQAGPTEQRLAPHEVGLQRVGEDAGPILHLQLHARRGIGLHELVAVRPLDRTEGAIDLLRPEHLQVVADAHLVAQAGPHRLGRVIHLDEVQIEVPRSDRAGPLDHRHAAAEFGAAWLGLAVTAAGEADVGRACAGGTIPVGQPDAVGEDRTPRLAATRLPIKQDLHDRRLDHARAVGGPRPALGEQPLRLVTVRRADQVHGDVRCPQRHRQVGQLHGPTIEFDAQVIVGRRLLLGNGGPHQQRPREPHHDALRILDRGDRLRRHHRRQRTEHGRRLDEPIPRRTLLEVEVRDELVTRHGTRAATTLARDVHLVTQLQPVGPSGPLGIIDGILGKPLRCIIGQVGRHPRRARGLAPGQPRDHERGERPAHRQQLDRSAVRRQHELQVLAGELQRRARDLHFPRRIDAVADRVEGRLVGVHDHRRLLGGDVGAAPRIVGHPDAHDDIALEAAILECLGRHVRSAAVTAQGDDPAVGAVHDRPGLHHLEPLPGTRIDALRRVALLDPSIRPGDLHPRTGIQLHAAAHVARRTGVRLFIVAQCLRRRERGGVLDPARGAARDPAIAPGRHHQQPRAHQQRRAQQDQPGRRQPTKHDGASARRPCACSRCSIASRTAPWPPRWRATKSAMLRTSWHASATVIR